MFITMGMNLPTVPGTYILQKDSSKSYKVSIVDVFRSERPGVLVVSGVYVDVVSLDSLKSCPWKWSTEPIKIQFDMRSWS